MKKYANYILRAGLVLLGVFIAAASKVLLPIEMGTFWRVFVELAGYALIAFACATSCITGKPKE